MFTESGRKSYPSHERPPADSSLALMADFVGASKRVLDVGCAQGFLARLLVANECRVVGIDANPEAAAEAQEVCEAVVIGDLDVEPLSALAAPLAPFDVIVFGDVLEHVRNPLALLENARSLLADRGFIVASIPNVAHGAVRLAMLDGRFAYQEYGLLDETHLRFFTRSTCERLLLDAGFSIDALSRTRVALFEESDLVPPVRREDYQASVIEDIVADPEHETLQFIIRAYPISHDARLRVLAKRALDAQTALESAELHTAALRRELNDLQSKHRAACERASELDRERALHLAARDRADIVIAASAQRIGEMQRRMEALEAMTAELREKEVSLAAQLADAARETQQLTARTEMLDDDVRRRSRECDELAAKSDVLLRETHTLRSDLARAVEERDAAYDEHQALEAHVVSMLDEMTEKMRKESELLATEIASIQSGVVWRARNALRKILRRP